MQTSRHNVFTVNVKSISLLFVSTVSGAGLSFFAQMIFARRLTVDEYGLLATYLVTINMLLPIAGFGIGQFWLKVFGAEGFAAQRWIRPSLRLIGSSSLIACLLYILGAWFTSKAENSNSSIWFLAPLVVSYAMVELVTARLQLEERYSFLALWQLSPSMSRFLVAIGLFVFGGTLKHVGEGFFFTGMAIILSGAYLIKGIGQGKLHLIGHTNNGRRAGFSFSPSIFQVVRDAWPFALAGFFFLIYFQSDILLLKWLVNAKTAGIYNVAFTVMAAIYLIPSVVFQKFLLPKQHRWAEHDRSKFLEVFRFGCGTMLVLGVVIMILVQILSSWGVPFLFGKTFSASVQPLFILSFCIPIKFLATGVGGTLVTQHHMRRKVLYMGSSAVLNLFLNLILIPRWTYCGAAVATFISELNLLIIYLMAVRRNVFGADAWRGWKIFYRFH